MLYNTLQGKQNWDNLNRIFENQPLTSWGERQVLDALPPQFLIKDDDSEDTGAPSSSEESDMGGSPVYSDGTFDLDG